jgi:hypothetical protein
MMIGASMQPRGDIITATYGTFSNTNPRPLINVIPCLTKLPVRERNSMIVKSVRITVRTRRRYLKNALDMYRLMIIV